MVNFAHHIRSNVSTHSRPKAAGFSRLDKHIRHQVSTHSRPKAAGFKFKHNSLNLKGFNTQPPEGGWHKAHASKPTI